MKLICTPMQNQYEPLVQATLNVFDEVGVWRPDIKPVFDLFDEVEPDMVWCGIEYITKSFIDACNEYPNIKIALFANGVPRGMSPHVLCLPHNASDFIVEQAKENSENVVVLQKYADVRVLPDQEMPRSDILFCTNGMYYSQVKQLCPLFEELGKKYDLKIVGSVPCPRPEYIGTVSFSELGGFIQNATINLCHNNSLELTVALNNAFCITNSDNDIFVNYEDDPREMIEKFMQKKEGRHRQVLANTAYNVIINCDTAYHRIQSILGAMGIHEYDAKIKDLVGQL